MDYDSFIDQAWAEHATDPAAVAARLQAQGLPQVTEAARIVPMAHLAHHVLGQHLGHWQDALQVQQQLAALPCCPADGDVPAALRRFSSSLALAAGQDDRAAMAASDRVRVTVMAAASLAEHDTARASALLHEAVGDTQAAALPDSDPGIRALAANANNIAGALEEKAQLSPAERELMIEAAQVAGRFWQRAGTWLEHERAEYRLALVWLRAGDPALARQHAQQCLDIVAAQQGPALEQFFGWVALGRVERAAGNTAGQTAAQAQAEAAFAGLSEGDKGWCRASLDLLP